MEKIIVILLLLALGMTAWNATAKGEEGNMQQSISAFGDKYCDIAKDNRAGLFNLMPHRFLTRAAISLNVSSEEELYQILADKNISMDEIINKTLEEGGFNDADAGKKFYGETPYQTCSWSDALEVDCDVMYKAFAEGGINSIKTTHDTMVNAAREQTLQKCATIHIIADDEDLIYSLIMFHNTWYFVFTTSPPTGK